MPTIEDRALEAPVIGFLVTGVPVIKITDLIDDAVKKYELNPSNRSLLVVDGEGRLAGLVTDKDLTQLVDRNRTDPVATLIKSPEVVAIRDNANLGQLLRIMNGANPSGLPLDIVPVVDQETRPLGIIRRGSLTTQLDEQLAKGVFGRSAT